MRHLLVAEVRKITSLKLWWALLIGPLVFGILVSGAIAAVADDTAEIGEGISLIVSQLGIYISLAFVLIFVSIFGAVNASTEFRHKTITPTFLSARRDGVIAAKLIVTTAFGLLYGIVIAASTVMTTMLFSDDFEFNAPLRKVLLAGLVTVAVWSLMGAGFGLIVRSPVAATLILLAWFPLGELIVVLILNFGLGDAAAYVGSTLPGASTYNAIAAGQIAPPGTTWYDGFWPSMARVFVWAGLSVGLGWYLTRKRDVI